MEVSETLSRLGHLISRDVVELYCATGGMSDGLDSQCWTLWPLDSLASENAMIDSPVLLFADFLIHSHLYGLKYENENESSVHVEYGDGKGPQKVADSLDEFFGLYLSDPDKLGLWGES